METFVEQFNFVGTYSESHLNYLPCFPQGSRDIADSALHGFTAADILTLSTNLASSH